MKYKINELTPKKMMCGFAAVCPAIYEVEESGDKEE